MMSGAVPWQGWTPHDDRRYRPTRHAHAADQSAVMSERMSPNMFSITMTSKSQGRFTSSAEQRRHKPIGLNFRMTLSGFVEHLTKERERLDTLPCRRRSTARPAAALRRSASLKENSNIAPRFSGDHQRLTRLAGGDDPFPSSEQAFGGLPDHDQIDPRWSAPTIGSAPRNQPRRPHPA